MWYAYLDDGSCICEGTLPWRDVRIRAIVRLECEFGGKHETVLIPPDCAPVLFNTGEVVLGGDGSVKQLSQSIGYSDGKQEHFTRVRFDGTITKEEGPPIH